jgi:hypothetical protein
MDTASFLNDIADKLAKASVGSRELTALDFEADGRDISIRVRTKLHSSWYPPLGLILGRVGNTCLERGVTLSQLRRITFGDREIRVELSQCAGPVGNVFTFPIETTVGLPASDFRAAAS